MWTSHTQIHHAVYISREKLYLVARFDSKLIPQLRRDNNATKGVHFTISIQVDHSGKNF